MDSKSKQAILSGVGAAFVTSVFGFAIAYVTVRHKTNEKEGEIIALTQQYLEKSRKDFESYEARIREIETRADNKIAQADARMVAKIAGADQRIVQLTREHEIRLQLEGFRREAGMILAFNRAMSETNSGDDTWLEPAVMKHDLKLQQKMDAAFRFQEFFLFLEANGSEDLFQLFRKLSAEREAADHELALCAKGLRDKVDPNEPDGRNDRVERYISLHGKAEDAKHDLFGFVATLTPDMLK
jgi:hypothetical protein